MARSQYLNANKTLTWIAGTLFAATCALVVRYVAIIEAKITDASANIEKFADKAETKHENFERRIGSLETCCALSKRRD